MKKRFINLALGFAVMSLTGMSAVSAPPNTQLLDDILDQLEDIEAQLETLDGKLNDKLELRFPNLVNFPLEGTADAFEVDLVCDRAFKVIAIYATVRDPADDVLVTYNYAKVKDNMFGPEFAPPYLGIIANEEFTYLAGPDSGGYELLSQLQVDIPVGIADGGLFSIFGYRDPNTGNTTITVGAVVETAQDPDNECEIHIVDN